MSLYPKNHAAKRIDPALFRNPTAAYRGAPFWSWNCKLDRDQLLRQVAQMADMGFGGAHMHSRTGMASEYLGTEFMDHVKACVQEAKRRGLLMWLYDEDRWPSSFAGGLLTKDERFRERHLLFTPRPYGAGIGEFSDTMGGASRRENGRFLWRYAIELNSDGTLKHYRRLKENEKYRGKGALWYAYLEVCAGSTWYNNYTAGDVLSPAAMEKFVDITHEAYKRAVGNEFGKAVPAIFTDEPHFAPKRPLPDAFATPDLFWPITDDLEETYLAAYGEKLGDSFPEVIWNLPDNKPSVTRWRFHEHVAERFASAFADTIGNWCRKNGILMTGHMVAEESLRSQTTSSGEIMRHLRAFDIPGIDMLCDDMELTTAKQAQSVARQFGRQGVMSELYGVTGWHFDFAGYKGQGDWQAALGVTVRVPHLAWVSMAGEAKRDYPAAFGYQAPWWKRFPVVEDHFARLNTVLTRGKPVTRVGVVHPVESFWLCFGPLEQTHNERELREWQFKSITEWLLFKNVDFDYIAESLLPILSKKQKGKKLLVGAASYDVVILPGLRTIRGSTLDRLEAMVKAGGKVIFAGQIPDLVDAVPSQRAQKLAAKCSRVPFERPAIFQQLEEVRDIRILPGPGNVHGELHADNDVFLYQLRENGDHRYLFLCNTDRTRARHDARILIKGDWKLKHWDTMTGNTANLAATYSRGWTQLHWDAPAHGSLLLELEPGKRQKKGEDNTLPTSAAQEIARLADPLKVTLAEPNVLLLDIAQWRTRPTDNWQPREEILRIDDAARKQLHMPPRDGRMAQPWTDTSPDPVTGTLELRYEIHNDVAVSDAMLAIEDLHAVTITCDGQNVPINDTGYYVDESIRTTALPPFAPGTHELLIHIPMTRKRHVEAAYLLGDFGVTLVGQHARLTAPVRTLAWGDWTRQGLPFYAGNVTYHCELPANLPTTDLQIELRYNNPLADITIAGQTHPIAFAPFRAPLPANTTTFDITLYGNRANLLGPLHNTNKHWRWWGPTSWRTSGSNWSLEYQLRSTGLLAAPILMKKPVAGSQ
ncbi:MAG: hypothetical protein FWD61_09065 [Phycisphaerales bacterium]|nr:hypothetical protein [Phycisphaerales bacterium]